MLKRLSIWFVCLFFFCNCWSQPGYLKAKTAINTTNKIQSTSTAGKEDHTTAKDPVSEPDSLLNVLFATNEDCDLYINEELKGAVLKSKFLYLKLAPGNYFYKARSKATHDELKEPFTVTQGGTNEVFMDLLYFVDAKTAERESSRNEAKPPVQPQVLTEIKPAGQPQQIERIVQNKDAEVAAINSLIANMVQLKGGSFVMGNNKAPFADEVEHPVTINALLFSKYEVTQHQWESIMGYNPSLNNNCATCPVENVSWEEVMKFIRKLNVISHKKFRLPTEGEWEYVARLGGKTEIDTAGGQEEYIRKTAWYFGNAEGKTHPVGIKQSAASGVFDLTGNVSEWCSDWYGAYYYKEDFNQLNPEGPPLGKEKIIRGGNFKDYVGDRFRPSFRNKKIPTDKSGEIGFRLVMETNE